ncbi:hypothetical protein DL93DRAFT_783217 [Clavulina sp. PMI_390]|nr:hypothetical protein DL93DRAFT_783217 [Clavulina sp. PMI_390]
MAVCNESCLTLLEARIYQLGILRNNPSPSLGGPVACAKGNVAFDTADGSDEDGVLLQVHEALEELGRVIKWVGERIGTSALEFTITVVDELNGPVGALFRPGSVRGRGGLLVSYSEKSDAVCHKQGWRNSPCCVI